MLGGTRWAPQGLQGPLPGIRSAFLPGLGAETSPWAPRVPAEPQQVRQALTMTPFSVDLADLVRSAAQSADPFPVDFADAMGATGDLGYPSRSHAARVLEASFAEGRDYVRLGRTGAAMSVETFAHMCVTSPCVRPGASSVVGTLALVLARESRRAVMIAAREREVERKERELLQRESDLAMVAAERSERDEARRRQLEAMAAERVATSAEHHRAMTELVSTQRRLKEAHRVIARLRSEGHHPVVEQRAHEERRVPVSALYSTGSPEQAVLPGSLCSSPLALDAASSAATRVEIMSRAPQQMQDVSKNRYPQEFAPGAVLTSRSYLEYRGIDAEKIGCHSFGRIVAKLCTASGIATERLVAYRNPEDLPAFERAFEMWEKHVQEHPEELVQRPTKRSKLVLPRPPLQPPAPQLSSSPPASSASSATSASPRQRQQQAQQAQLFRALQ
eukprot:m51a1_g8865 hypothetical protein (447) ;mRNA; f:580621-582777